MKRIRGVVIVAVACLVVGLVTGSMVARAQEGAEKTTYLVVQEFEIASDQTMEASIGRLSNWVRTLRATGRHSSVRLFLHDWGPEAALYIVSETTDWNAIGTIFSDIVAGEPNFMKRPLGFAGHSDNIMTEIAVE